MMFVKIYLAIGVMYSVFVGLNYKFHFVKGGLVEIGYAFYDTLTFKEKLLCRVLDVITYPFVIVYNAYHGYKGDLFE